jgi:hypothetical protein
MKKEIMKKRNSVYKYIVSLYWKTIGKHKINKLINVALNEPKIDMSNIMVGDLRVDGGYYNGDRVI